jgi:hypothetical protein
MDFGTKRGTKMAAAVENIGPAVSGTEGLGNAAFKPAPFAEKKNAKDAAPAKSDLAVI